MALVFMLPFVLVEQMTRRLLINEIVGMAFSTFPYVDYEQRMGLNRIQTVFEHPILFGLFWSVGIESLVSQPGQAGQGAAGGRPRRSS